MKQLGVKFKFKTHRIFIFVVVYLSLSCIFYVISLCYCCSPKCEQDSVISVSTVENVPHLLAVFPTTATKTESN